MKKLICTSILTILIASMTTVRAQDYPEEYLGLPGDNLNLYAVMKVFQDSETLEAFERNLNAEDSHINNLDLNGDNMVDYLTVADYVDGNVHTIVLRSVLDRNEYQDVAVFTVEKLRDGSVQIQLIGDQALYGRNYIVEPIYAETPNPGYKGNQVQRKNVTVVTTTYYEVAAWPVISYIYSPRYTVWRSSWYWGYYPVYWNPWRPFYWHHYYGYHYNWYPDYYARYRHWDYPRYQRYNTFYYGSVRAHSTKVERRISEGNYKQTYSRPESRRDGEALYSSTQGTRSRTANQAPAAGTGRRDAAATGSRTQSSVSSSQPADRRSQSSVSRSQSSVSNQSAGQNGEARRTQSTVSSSQPAAGRSQSSVSRTQSSVSSQSAGQNGEARRTQSSVSGSQPAAGRSQSTVSRSQPAAGRSQSTVSRSQPATSRSQSSVQKSSPSVSQKSAPAARSQSSGSSKASSSAPSRSSSSKASSSAPSRSSSSKASSSAPSRNSSSKSSSTSSSSSSKSSSSKSSKSSENSSRSTRR